MTTIAVFGATGRTGNAVTELALRQGYQVRALVRTPSKLAIGDPNLTVIPGDLNDAPKVEETVRGTDAVLFLVGMSPNVRTPADVREAMTRSVLAAMQKAGVKRVIRLVSLVGARDDRDKMGFVARLQLWSSNKAVVQDETAGADLIRRSGLEWTIVRNGLIRTSAPKGRYTAGYVGGGLNSIAAGDLAAFILDELKSGTYLRQMPLLRD
jgi:uncharacterized protein YbjT (DUF2867 family)